MAAEWNLSNRIQGIFLPTMSKVRLVIQPAYYEFLFLVSANDSVVNMQPNPPSYATDRLAKFDQKKKSK